jgi:hypothetical protein
MLNITESIVGLMLFINKIFLGNISSKFIISAYIHHIILSSHTEILVIFEIYLIKYYGANSLHQYRSCFILLWYSL